ncbi:uncharacterized protein LOC141800787 isoform X2 [Halichoeres trimaculatus]|uniref:uncharacterized protein LOC141800787 isoform X2 n=1 Tax=Halichoeres trimaculatus TaxID=147232 RepID=UPI003D9F6323
MLHNVVCLLKYLRTRQNFCVCMSKKTGEKCHFSRSMLASQETEMFQVEKMTTKRELYEILKDLSSEELEDFNLDVELEEGVQLLSKLHPKGTKAEEVVELMMEKYSEESVELTKNALRKENRTRLVKRLSDSRAGSKEKHSETDTKQLPSLIQRVEMITSDIEALMDVLADLTEEEIGYFRNILKHKSIKRNKSCVSWGQLLQTDTHRVFVGGHQETVFLMIMTCGQLSVETTRGILKKMKRTDLLQRLTDTRSRLKKKESDEQCSALIQKVATMVAVQELLLETLHCLSGRELSEFKEFLKQIVSKQGLKAISLYMRIDKGDGEKIVDLMMETYGQQSVELTREVLEEMNRTDLVQMLSESSSALKEKHFVDQHQPKSSAAAVKEDAEFVLLQTLRGLSLKELEKFRFLLQFTYFQRSLPQIQTEPAHQLKELVDLMVKNQHPVEVTKEVLMDMNRSDLAERLSGLGSGLKGESQPGRLQRKPSSLNWTVFKTLRGLSSGEFELFKLIVQQTAPRKGPIGVMKYRISSAGRTSMAKLMVKIHGQQCVKVTADVLKKMKRTDLAGKLSGTGSRLKAQKKHQSQRLQRTSTLTADHEQLLETPEKISPGELEKFKQVLQETKLRGLPKIPGRSMETADKAETRRLMVENYGQQSVEVMKDVLEMMKRMDLVEKLSESSSGSQGPSGSLEPEACGGSTTDSSPWTKMEPGVNSSRGDESPTYSLQSETGNYECSVSGLRWVCEEEVSFQYHFRSWEGHMDRMESIKYMPAGPLIDIKVITGRLNEVYLPHWICTDECGDVVENVSEVTPSHVKLSEPVFSPRGVLIRAGFTVKIRCCVLIYYKPNTPFLKLRVYLIPCDPALQQTVNQAESLEGFKTIKNPRPDRALRLKQGFSLTADMKTAEINPQEITLGYDNQDKIFYQVFIEKPNRKFQLALFYSRKDVYSKQVWTCDIREDDLQNPASVDKPSVDDQLSAQMQRLTNSMQAVKISTTDRERLLKILEDLTQEEFKKFKWYLQDRGVLAGLTGISRSELENKDMLELVDLMLGTYRKHCMELTRRVLKAMNRNDLVEKLSDIS